MTLREVSIGPWSHPHGAKRRDPILDPEDGKAYKAEVWAEGGKLKVRGYVGFLYRTQTWVEGS
jgi:uncharacterized protein (DUF2147 family)